MPNRPYQFGGTRCRGPDEIGLAVGIVLVVILSHKHRFIFIKTNKTAGTSVEIALSRHCGSKDIITPISPEDEDLRAALGGRGPQNHLLDPSEEGTSNSAVPEGLKFYNHMDATEIRALVGAEVWNGYFKFCIERDPWERFVSLYFWRNRIGPRPSISDFLESGVPADLRSRGWDLYTIGGQVAVDRVLRYESLDTELEDVRRRIGIPAPLVLPNAKSRYRSDNRSAVEILSDEQKQKIASMFNEEIRLMGYASPADTGLHG